MGVVVFIDKRILSQKFLFEIHSFTKHHDLNINTVFSLSLFRWYGLSIEFQAKRMSNLSRNWESKYIQISDGDLIIWGLTLVFTLSLPDNEQCYKSLCFINTLRPIHQVTIPPFTATCSTCKGSGRVIKVLILRQWQLSNLTQLQIIIACFFIRNVVGHAKHQESLKPLKTLK